MLFSDQYLKENSGKIQDRSFLKSYEVMK